MRYLCLAFLIACAAVTPPPEYGGGCVETIRAAVDYRFRPSDIDSIRKAGELWSSASGGYTCMEFTAVTPVDVVFHRADTNADLKSVDPGWARHAGIALGRDIYIVTSDFGELMVTAIATHELGHFYGLLYFGDNHSSSDSSIMRATINPDAIASGHLPSIDAEAYCAAQICRR